MPDPGLGYMSPTGVPTSLPMSMAGQCTYFQGVPGDGSGYGTYLIHSYLIIFI